MKSTQSTAIHFWGEVTFQYDKFGKIDVVDMEGLQFPNFP